MSEVNDGGQDTPGLSDLDWLEINECGAAFRTGDEKALRECYEYLSRRDAGRYSCILGALCPIEYSEALKDAMASNGIIREEITETVQLRNAPKKH